MTVIGINRNLSITLIISLGFHLSMLFGVIPNFSTQAGEQGEERLIVSFGAIELPAIITSEQPEPPPQEEPLPDKDLITTEPPPEQKEEPQPELISDNPNPGTPEFTKGQIEDIKTRFLRQVVTKIHKVKRYPESARRRDWEGTAKVEFVLSGEGKVLSVSIITSSGYRILDKEAIEMIKRAAPFPQIPEELERSEMTLLMPIGFKLNEKR